MAKALKSWNYGGWAKGVNNYDGSRSTIENTEFTPISTNAVTTGKGSVTKASGADRFGGEVASGFAIQSGVQYTTTSFDRLIVHAGTSTYYKNGTSWTALTGLTLTSTYPAQFCLALDRLYCSQQGLGGLYVSTNGTSWSLVTNGRELTSMVFFNSRLYGIDPATGYIWYSNPFTTTTSPGPSRSLGNFATYDSSLPTKNAGFLELQPGTNVIPSRIEKVSNGTSDNLNIYTKNHGYWKIGTRDVANVDGSIAHSIFQSNGYFGSTAPNSIGKVGNDSWFYDGEMLNSLGEVALYNNLRVTPKFGKLRGYLDSINPDYADLPSIGYKDNTVYFAYPVGTYNDRLIAYDTVLGAPSSELTGFNCSFFLLYQEGNRKRLLYGSSNPSDSYVYEMGIGTDIGDNAIEFLLEPKSTDCGSPGRVKRLAKVRVFYTSVFGTLAHRIIFEETRDLTGSIQIGNSTTLPVGMGSTPMGAWPMGQDYDTTTTFASLATNSFFEIEGEFEAFERVTVQLSNSVAGENAQIDDIQYLYTEGNQFETLD